MRIISGVFKGKKLEWVSDEATRPTTDRVKENIFNILGNVAGATVLDLFCGSGQMGIECLSRGVKDVVFCDLDTKIVKANLNALKGDKLDRENNISQNIPPFVKGVSRSGGGFNVIAGDYISCLEKIKNYKFNLVFLDPPYNNTEYIYNAVNYLRDNNMLCYDAVIVCESESGELSFDGFNIDIRNYGKAFVYFIKQAQAKHRN